MSIIAEARKIRAQFVKFRNLATDDMALQVPDLYPVWEADTSYVTGDRVLFDDVLYKVLMDHVSQSDWTPTVAPSLFAKVLIPDSDVIPEWEQPSSTNPYMAGDTVTYNGHTWKSTVDNNVWEPGVYGWEVVE